MRDGKRRAGLLTSRAVVLLTTVVVAIGLTGLTTAAIAATGGGNGGGNGNGNGNGGHKHHHKKKKCPAGTHKITITKKNGKKKKKCVPDPVVTPPPAAPQAAAAALTVTPATHDFGSSPHGSGTCGGCPTQVYTVTNTGGSTSGTPTISFTVVKDHSPSTNDQFAVTTNGCTAGLAPGASCTFTVTFHPPNNNGDEEWESTMSVTASPGGTAQADLTGIAS